MISQTSHLYLDGCETDQLPEGITLSCQAGSRILEAMVKDMNKTTGIVTLFSPQQIMNTVPVPCVLRYQKWLLSRPFRWRGYKILEEENHCVGNR